jgi:hypothetical protein
MSCYLVFGFLVRNRCGVYYLWQWPEQVLACNFATQYNDQLKHFTLLINKHIVAINTPIHFQNHWIMNCVHRLEF